MYQPLILPHFHKQLKAYTKKYRHLKDEVVKAVKQFNKARHPRLGNNIYKIRVGSRDIQKGKSKSFRLLVFIIEAENFIIPITLYFKGDQEDINKKEINDHLEALLFELRTQKLMR